MYGILKIFQNLIPLVIHQLLQQGFLQKHLIFKTIAAILSKVALFFIFFFSDEVSPPQTPPQPAQSSEMHSDFFFRQRRGRVDIKRVNNLDIEKIVSEVTKKISKKYLLTNHH